MTLRRFSIAPLLLILVWLLWFVLPPTHNPALLQWQSRLGISATPAPVGSSRDVEFVGALSSVPLPDGSYPGGSFQKARVDALEAAGRKFPNDAAICAAQLLAQIDQLHLAKVQHPGPSSSADLNWSVKLTEVETPDPQLLKSWFAATARGAKLEPNNTFWDWARIIGLLAANRDDEVWAVLRAASRKTDFNDHTTDASLTQINVALQKYGSLSPVGQLSIHSAMLLPHLAPMREATRQMSDNASGLRLQNTPQSRKQALEGMRDLVLMARVMRREAKEDITFLVAQAIEQMAFYGGSYSPLTFKPGGLPRPGATLTTYGSSSRSLLRFARGEGRTDVAAQLVNAWNEAGVWRRKVRPGFGSIFPASLSTSDVIIAQGGDWFGALLLMQLPPLFVWALLCSLLLRFIPPWRRESGAQPTLLSWSLGAVVSSWVLLTMTSTVLWVLWNARSTPGAVPLDSLLLTFYQGEGGNGEMVPPLWQSFFPLTVGLLVAFWLATLWDARRRGLPTLGTRLRGLFNAPDDEMTRFDFAPLLSLMLTLAIVVVFNVGVLLFLIVPSLNRDYSTLHDGSTAGPVLACFGGAVLAFLIFRLRNAPGLAFGLILARRVAWGQLLFVSLLWGLLWMVATPAQKRFNTSFTKYIQVGSAQIARKKAGL